jgi:hypothetical protein
MKPVRDYTAKAVAIVNAGSAIKSRVKEANEDLARAFDLQREVVQNALLDVMREERNAGRAVIESGREVYAEDSMMAKANAAYYAFPFQLNHFRPKHKEAVEAVIGTAIEDTFAKIEELVALRAEVKAVEVVKFDRKEPTFEENIKDRVLKSFAEVNAEKKAQFDWAAEIIREMNAELPYEAEKGLLAPISVRPVYCMNYAGTAWVRIDWYFRGDKMASNLILAAVGKIVDEKKGK